MIIEQNRETIFQLYNRVCSPKHPPMNNQIRGVSSASMTIRVKPACLKAFKRFFGIVSEAFPDFKLEIDNLIAKEDKVMVRYTISGTQRGHFLGLAPTNEPMTISGLDVFRLDNGKVIEHSNAAHQISALPVANPGPQISPRMRKVSGDVKPASRAKLLSLST